MAVISGLTGEVSLDGGTNGLSTIHNWRVEDKVDLSERSAANTGGGPVQVVGKKDWTGSFDWSGKTPPIVPGTSYSFYGYNGDDSYSGTIICESITQECDIEGGGNLTGSATFGGNSDLTKGSGAAPAEDTDINIFPAAVCQVTLSTNLTVPSYTAIPTVRGWTFTAKRISNVYGGNGLNYKRRTVGPWAGVTLSVRLYEADTGAIFTPSTTYLVRAYASATEYWQLTYAVLNNADPTVDIEGGKPNEYTYTFSWDAYGNVSGTRTKGTLVPPTGSAWYA